MLYLLNIPVMLTPKPLQIPQTLQYLTIILTLITYTIHQITILHLPILLTLNLPCHHHLLIQLLYPML